MGPGPDGSWRFPDVVPGDGRPPWRLPQRGDGSPNGGADAVAASTDALPSSIHATVRASPASLSLGCRCMGSESAASLSRSTAATSMDKDVIGFAASPLHDREFRGIGHERAAASIVIACHTEERFEQLLEAIDSAREQAPAPHEVIIAVDHNHALSDSFARRSTGSRSSTIRAIRARRGRATPARRWPAIRIWCFSTTMYERIPDGWRAAGTVRRPARDRDRRDDDGCVAGAASVLVSRTSSAGS